MFDSRSLIMYNSDTNFGVLVKTKKIDNPKEIMGINTIKQLESFEE